MQHPDSPQAIVSGDGSHTLISSIFNTSYHSIHGAITESTVVFMQAGLDYLYSKGYNNISIFEMGFGSGLNALLSYLWAIETKVCLTYHTIEAYPISREVYTTLNYGSLCDNEAVFDKLHEVSWNQNHKFSETFSFKKYLDKMENLNVPERYDLIFYDAFGPGTQPSLWEPEAIKRMYEILNPNGILVSFCAQGAFKRNLKSAGFRVESLPGPPFKREMTRAIKGYY